MAQRKKITLKERNENIANFTEGSPFLQNQEKTRVELVDDIVFTLEGMIEAVKNDQISTKQIYEMRDIVLSPYLDDLSKVQDVLNKPRTPAPVTEESLRQLRLAKVIELRSLSLDNTSELKRKITEVERSPDVTRKLTTQVTDNTLNLPTSQNKPQLSVFADISTQFPIPKIEYAESHALTTTRWNNNPNWLLWYK